MVIVSLPPDSAASAFSLAQYMLKTKGSPGIDQLAFPQEDMLKAVS